MTGEPSEEPGPRSFLSILIGDVIVASDLLRTNDTAAERRNLVRSTLAGIEGLVWIARESVRDSLETLDELTPLASMALREQTYMIANNGDIIEQIRFVTLPAMIQLVCRQAARIVPDLNVRFDSVGWSQLKKAIEIRNRVTHPKSLEDLTITESDLAILSSGFSWVAATTEYVMAMIVVVQRGHLNNQRELLTLLESGDPSALQEYQAVVDKLQIEES